MRIELPSGTAAEIARPIGNPSMGLVVAPDIFGLRPLYDDLVARLANEWNMVVVAVEPFAGKQLPLEVEARFAAMPDRNDSEQLRDLVEAADVTGEMSVGVLGFCMGGMYALKSLATGRFYRTVSFYGMIRVPPSWMGPGHGQPIDAVHNGDAESVLAIIAGRDSFTPDDDVADLERCGATVVRYPEAEHGFAHDPHRPTHRSADAADAFERAREWLLE